MSTPRLVAAALFASAAVAVPSTASADPSPRAARPSVSITVPAEVVEGDRYTAVVKLSRTAGAKRLVVEQQVPDVFGRPQWETVKQSEVRGKRYVVKAVAGTSDTDRYRARVTYETGKPARSKTSRTTVWHWLPLNTFAAYRSTSGVWPSYWSIAMNGTQYKGWSTFGGYPSWETSYTVGRHCRAIRGDVGVADTSASGSSAAFQLVADETTTVFSSQPLTPGMVQPLLVDLATPYRLSIRAQNTSPAGVRAYPAFGNPELLCTGVG